MASTLLLYLGLMGLGIVIGSKKMDPEKQYPWLGKIQFAALMVLLVALGMQIGADDQVVSSLSEIGIVAFIVAAAAMFGSVFCLSLVRRWIKLDKEGVPKND